ncbi:hypothetical protein GQ457_11G000900 [Hibiscus cannabinus]
MRCLCSVFDVKKQEKPIREVRTRNWKLREGENRLSGLLEDLCDELTKNLFFIAPSRIQALKYQVLGFFLAVSLKKLPPLLPP